MPVFSLLTKDNPFKIGYTSDTRQDEDVENQYKGVDIIIPHLGSIDENDFKFEEERRGMNHLMLKGIISTINKSANSICLVILCGGPHLDQEISMISHSLRWTSSRSGDFNDFTKISCS